MSLKKIEEEELTDDSQSVSTERSEEPTPHEVFELDLKSLCADNFVKNMPNIDFYNENPKFKTKLCRQRICRNRFCNFYHNEKDRHISIFWEGLLRECHHPQSWISVPHTKSREKWKEEWKKICEERNQEKKALGLWKISPCKKPYPHSQYSCSYLHEEKPQNYTRQ
jgi:hypothetical protein